MTDTEAKKALADELCMNLEHGFDHRISDDEARIVICALRSPVTPSPSREEVAKWKQAASVEAGLRQEFQEAESKLSAAYLRLRALIPGAFNTPLGSTGEQVWETTENALKAILALSQAQPEPVAWRSKEQRAALVKEISAAFAEGKHTGGYDTLFDMLASTAIQIIDVALPAAPKNTRA